MTTPSGKVPPHFVVIVPGYMGSKLRDKGTGEIVWVDLSTLPWNFLQWGDWLDNLLKTLAYPNPALESAGMIDAVTYLPPWGKLENYERLVEKLRSMGYRVSAAQCFGHDDDGEGFDESRLDVYAFAYDWRQDNRQSASELGAAIKRWSKHHPGKDVWIIAHSNGGLVARWYIEMEGGKEVVERLFLMGSPWDGTPKALRMAINGFDRLFRLKFSLFNIPERTRNLVRSFPSIYQLIPTQNPFLRDEHNQPVDPFAADAWLRAPALQAYLQDGRRFSEDLGTKLSVETYCFFGTRQLTPTSGRVAFGAAGRWATLRWDPETEVGDGTIPQSSAVHPRATEKLPYPVSHGDIYVDKAVLEKLRYEMMDRYRTDRAEVRAGRLRVVFEHGNSPVHEDFYSPGQQIKLWATVEKFPPAAVEGGDAPPDALRLSPVTNATITVRAKWRQPLPGEPEGRVEPPSEFGAITLERVADVPGRYEGQLTAPNEEGFYDLEATVKVHREKTVTLSELIGVEPATEGSALRRESDAVPDEAAEAGEEAEAR